MRSKTLCGLGLAVGALAFGGVAWGQFANGQPNAQPNRPQPVQQAQAIEGQPTHPWMVRPEHGEWFIVVKSYVGDEARDYAQQLAAEIRQKHNAAAYLFEWGSAERKKEMERRQQVREKMVEKQAPFLELREEIRKKAEAEGTIFDDTPVTVRIPTVEIREQWAVLIGGFKDMDTASRALQTIRRWAPPEGKDHLLDRAVISDNEEAQAAFMNPYKAAFVVPNPAKRRDNPEPEVDPLLKKLNEHEELSLLKCKKPVTLVVQSFTVPTRMVSKDSEPGLLGKLFNDKSARMFDATAMQAKSLAEALRHPNMKPQPFESYVLHIRTGSLVCVGGFDSADDPELERVKAQLQSMTFGIADRQDAQAYREKMFVHVFVMPIPKVD